MAEDLKMTFDALDTAVTDKYYLINPQEVRDLISIRKAFKYRNREWGMVKNDMDSLCSRLTKEYDKSYSRYNQIMRQSDNRRKGKSGLIRNSHLITKLKEMMLLSK